MILREIALLEKMYIFFQLVLELLLNKCSNNIAFKTLLFSSLVLRTIFQVEGDDLRFCWL